MHQVNKFKKWEDKGNELNIVLQASEIHTINRNFNGNKVEYCKKAT